MAVVTGYGRLRIAGGYLPEFTLQLSVLVVVRFGMEESRESSEQGSVRGSAERWCSWPTFLSAFIAALGPLTVGYAMGYPSSALLDLSELQDGYAFEKGSPISDFFAVSFAVFSFSCTVGDLWMLTRGPYALYNFMCAATMLQR